MITWARILEAFLDLINTLLQMFRKKERENEGAAGQKEEDKINSDPADWFNTHFSSGVRDQETVSKPDSDSTKTADSDKSGKQ